ncbi:hypothetical protein [Ruminococcus sp.]|nr:hypothetical protein [Ruminococcus sp.]MBQ8967158.1 hypothetical protein [Ruminococcus sp.]
MTFKQLLKAIFEHMAAKGMLEDLEKKYPQEDEQENTVRSEISGAQ